LGVTRKEHDVVYAHQSRYYIVGDCGGAGDYELVFA
jgi:hypothetical protein